jgi:hypothetical protein
MNAVLKEAVDPITTVDQSNPWLGLASFTEETRAYFFGRDEEVAELARRVQRKLLTLLFGQSGLGKTSILRAGLVPRLRGQGYCPIYVRIAYGREAPEPAEQIKQAIMQSAQRSGHWTQAGVAGAGIPTAQRLRQPTVAGARPRGGGGAMTPAGHNPQRSCDR